MHPLLWAAMLGLTLGLHTREASASLSRSPELLTSEGEESENKNSKMPGGGGAHL